MKVINIFLPTCLALCLLLTAGCTKKISLRQEMELRLKKIEANNKKACVADCFCFVGDSNMELIEVQSYFTEPACNYGWRGSTTKDTLAKKQKVHELKPSAIIMLVGGNDLLQLIPPEEIDKNYNELITYYKTFCKNIYCISTPPIQAKIYVKNSDIQNLNQYLEKTCKKLGATFVNIFPLLLKDGVMDPGYSQDPVHLNKAGHNVVMDELKKYLKK